MRTYYYSVLYQQAGEEYSFQIEFGAKPMPALADVTWIIETPNKTHEVRTSSTSTVQYVYYNALKYIHNSDKVQYILMHAWGSSSSEYGTTDLTSLSFADSLQISLLGRSSSWTEQIPLSSYLLCSVSTLRTKKYAINLSLRFL